LRLASLTLTIEVAQVRTRAPISAEQQAVADAALKGPFRCVFIKALLGTNCPPGQFREEAVDLVWEVSQGTRG
jgi:hypothetical protein